MSFATFILLLILFVFFAVMSVRHFQVRAKRFWAMAIAISLATATIYLFTRIYMEVHPTTFLFVLFLVIGVIVFLSAKYSGR